MNMNRFRHATPLEDINRTWTRTPKYLDKFYFQDKINQYVDPDGDEDKVKQMVEDKRLKRNEMKLKHKQ